MNAFEAHEIKKELRCAPNRSMRWKKRHRIRIAFLVGQHGQTKMRFGMQCEFFYSQMPSIKKSIEKKRKDKKWT